MSSEVRRAGTLSLGERSGGFTDESRPPIEAQATGKYVAIIATDDVMEPERLKVQVARLEGLPDDHALVYSDVSLIDENGELTGRTLSAHYWEGCAPPEGDIFTALLGVCFVPAPSVLVRRDALLSAGGYDESLVLEDWDMWLRVSRRHKVAFSPYVSTRYRVLSTSLSQSSKVEMAQSSLRLLAKWLGEPDARAAAIRSMRLQTHRLWAIDRRASLPGLRLLCDLQPGHPSQPRYYLARLGVSYDCYAGILRLVQNLRVRFEPRVRQPR